MSKSIRELFMGWMIASGKAKNTASNYLTGVNIVSGHCKYDVLAIEDLDELERLYRLYGPKGEYADIGASNSNNVHNGLKQWIGFNQYRQSEPCIDPQQGYKQWDDFLARWPVAALRELTLETYYSLKVDDSFYSWMRNHTNKLGDFKEGLMSAGVRLRGANAKDVTASDVHADEQYIWYKILGASAQDAFDNLKSELLTAVTAVQQGDLSVMKGLANAPGSLVWKVAFLYQDRTKPLVLPFFNQKQLRRVLGPDARGSVRELQEQLMLKRGDQDLLEFAADLERRAMKEPTAQAESYKEAFAMDKPGIALNQILYGPPGTGKTYASIDAALKILDPAFWAEHQTDRAALKTKFDELVQAERIRFVTFHQSFSYEDFVEGLRASTDGEHLSYRVESGVFKQVCEQARYVSGTLTEDDVIESFLVNISKAPMMLSTVRGKAFEVSYKAGNTTVNCVPQASAAELALPANIEHIRSMMRGAEPSNLYCASYVKAIAQYLRSQLAEQVRGVANNTQPYVLIIDEINRGNISRIFGELITLIEPSKRAGAAETLSVTLPYSKEPFSVPDNVYLIGTMNTADRSLAGLDIALRRRFEFVEMPPRPELLRDVRVAGVNIGELLMVMNQRIEVLLGRDYQLGHAYFMPLKDDATLSRLALILRNQILPLLQEYFFEDWQRIAWVLNDHRKPVADQFVQLKKNRLSELFGNEVSVPNNGDVWQINTEAFERITAYSGVIAVVNVKESEVAHAELEA